MKRLTLKGNYMSDISFFETTKNEISMNNKLFYFLYIFVCKISKSRCVGKSAPITDQPPLWNVLEQACCDGLMFYYSIHTVVFLSHSLQVHSPFDGVCLVCSPSFKDVKHHTLMTCIHTMSWFLIFTMQELKSKIKIEPSKRVLQNNPIIS